MGTLYTLNLPLIGVAIDGHKLGSCAWFRDSETSRRHLALSIRVSVTSQTVDMAEEEEVNPKAGTVRVNWGKFQPFVELYFFTFT